MKRSRTKMQKMTYEPYANCPFCNGRGCIGCKERKNLDEAAARQQSAAQDELKKHLLFSAHLDSPAEMATLQEVFNAEALSQAFTTSDISDEEALHYIGNGSRESGEQRLAFLFAMSRTNAASTSATFVISPEERRLLLDEIKARMASERGVERIRQTLVGKPGEPT
jgi:hypothetical protein